VGLTRQLIEDSILADGNAMHPPKARCPTAEVKKRNPVDGRHFR